MSKLRASTLLALVLFPVLGSALTTFGNFCSTSSMTLNGSTASNTPNAQCTLRLTPNSTNQRGSAYLPVTLSSNGSFSTFFTFRMATSGADGFTFVVQAAGANALGSGGGSLGYQGIGTSVAVEFDTWNNGVGGSFNDTDNNHVAIDVNGSMLSVASATAPATLNSGNPLYAWIDYNGSTKILEVRVAAVGARPSAPTLSATVDIPAALGTTSAFVGFTGATGGGAQIHEIVNWQFDPSYAPVLIPIPTFSGWTMVLFGAALAMAALAVLRR